MEKIHHLERLRECAVKHLAYIMKEQKRLIICVEKEEDPQTKQEYYKIIPS